MKLKVADFFCGAGGFSEGFRMKGFDVVFALDNWKPAVTTHKLNHIDCNTVQMDILDLDTPEKIDRVVPDTEIIIGSPPCVSFSGSNKAGKADKTLGIKLIEAFLKIIAWKKSKGNLKCWILENVPNASKFIKDEYSWRELGLPGDGPSLKVSVRKILNAADYGVPQTRKRLFCGDYPVPEKINENDWITLKHVLELLTNPIIFRKNIFITDPNFKLLKISSEELTDHFYDTNVERFEWERARRAKRDHGFMGKMSFPENLEKPSRTIMATRSASTREAMILGVKDDGHYSSTRFRMPTIREIASIMSFPITYQFEGNGESTKYKLVGNAVCPKLIAAIAESIANDYGMKISNEYIFPDNIPKLTFNLNGMRIERKKEKPKRFNSKFAVHVPEMKIRGFRVELNNTKSDFDKEKIRWDCILHHGSGKNAKKCYVNIEDVEKLIKIWDKSVSKDYSKNFNKLVEDVSSIKNRIPDSITFQKIYCKSLDSNGFLGPMETLEEIRKVVDKNFPSSAFDKMIVKNEKDIVPIGRGEIPIRILMSLYACKSITKS